MKYWKNGFYDEPINGSVEITDEYYNKLLNGQSAGLQIVENNNGVPILIEYEFTIEDIKNQKLKSLREYDASKSVNQFCINNILGWLSKSDRVGLMNSIYIWTASIPHNRRGWGHGKGRPHNPGRHRKDLRSVPRLSREFHRPPAGEGFPDHGHACRTIFSRTTQARKWAVTFCIAP